MTKQVAKKKSEIIVPEGLKYPLLKKHRVRRLLGLRELADKVGVSRQALCDYERGLYPPTIEVFERLQKSLGLTGDIVEYFGRRPKATPQRKIKCSIENCEKKALCKNVCKTHYTMLYDNHEVRKKRAKSKKSTKN